MANLSLGQAPTSAKSESDLVHFCHAAPPQGDEEFYERQVKVEEVEAAILLATARRLLRSPEAPKLGPMRSLHYFTPVIEGIRSNPPSESYLEYLRRKLAAVGALNSQLPHPFEVFLAQQVEELVDVFAVLGSASSHPRDILIDVAGFLPYRRAPQALSQIPSSGPLAKSNCPVCHGPIARPKRGVLPLSRTQSRRNDLIEQQGVTRIE